MKQLIFSLLLVSTIRTYAQDSVRKSDRGFEISINAGGQVQKMSGLNERLQVLGFEKAKTFGPSIGFSFNWRLSKFLIGYELGLSSAGDNNSTSTLNFGLQLSTNSLRTGNFVIAPRLGAGYLRMVHKQAINSPVTNFDAILLTGRNQVELEHKSIYADAGVDLKFKEKNGERIMPFLRLGYRFGLSEKEWEVMKANSNGGPRDRAGIFYFQLMMGIGR